MIYLTEEMFASGKPAAQGEVLIWTKKHAPESVLRGIAALKLGAMKLDGNQMVLGHSETGHHHVLEATREVPISKAALALIDAANSTFVELKLMEECRLRHERDVNAHETLVLPPGDYIRGIREEQTIEGWRQVAD